MAPGIAVGAIPCVPVPDLSVGVEVRLENWLVARYPRELGRSKGVQVRDLLHWPVIDPPEAEITANNLSEVLTRGSTAYGPGELDTVGQAVPYLHLNDSEKKDAPAVAYLACVLESPMAQTVALVTGGRDDYAVWLNGGKVCEVESFRWTEAYGDLRTISLNQGDNLLLIKVAGGTTGWGMGVSLLSLQRAAVASRENSLPLFLRDYLIAPQGYLELRPRSVQGLDAAQSASITTPGYRVPPDKIEHLLRTGRLSCVDLPAGVYTITAQFVRQTVTEQFYHGDVEAACRQARTKYAELLVKRENNDAAADLDLLLQRIDYLAAAQNRRPEKNLGERDAVVWLAELRRAEAFLDGRGVDWRSTPGRHLRTYVSASDGTRQAYLISLPRLPESGGAMRALDDKLPLVVVYPATSPSRPHFVTSYHLDFSDLVNTMEMQAQTHGYAVLTASARNQQHNAIGARAVLECIAAAESSYPIDGDRLYFMGGCAGGRDALMLAARHPGLAAAVAVHMPSVRGDQAPPGTPDWQAKMEELRSRPYFWGTNLQHTPVLISCGQYDRHASSQNSSRLARELHETGVPVVYKMIPDACDGYFPEANNQSTLLAFDFFAGKRLPGRLKAISLQADHQTQPGLEWLTLVPRDQRSDLARCDARWTGAHELDVTCSEVKEIQINLAKAPWTPGGVLLIRVNGKVGYDRVPAGDIVKVALPQKAMVSRDNHPFSRVGADRLPDRPPQ